MHGDFQKNARSSTFLETKCEQTTTQLVVIHFRRCQSATQVVRAHSRTGPEFLDREFIADFHELSVARLDRYVYVRPIILTFSNFTFAFTIAIYSQWNITQCFWIYGKCRLLLWVLSPVTPRPAECEKNVHYTSFCGARKDTARRELELQVRRLIQFLAHR